jgi:hypothetical protein
MHRMIGFMTGAAVCHGVWLGDEVGLYRTMAAAGPATAAEIAYTRFRRATETPMNLVLEARP